MKQEVGYYLHREGPNLGKHRVPRLLLPSALDAQFGTPYPRSAGFDTDIGAFIESFVVSSSEDSMDPSTRPRSMRSAPDLGPERLQG